MWPSGLAPRIHPPKIMVRAPACCGQPSVQTAPPRIRKASRHASLTPQRHTHHTFQSPCTRCVRAATRRPAICAISQQQQRSSGAPAPNPSPGGSHQEHQTHQTSDLCVQGAGAASAPSTSTAVAHTGAVKARSPSLLRRPKPKSDTCRAAHKTTTTRTPKVRMVEGWNGRMVEWSNGRRVEGSKSRKVKGSKGGMVEWSNGRMGGLRFVFSGAGARPP